MMPLVEFVNLNELEIRADVSEKYMGKIKEGDFVDITFASIENPVRTKIKRVSDVINSKSRTLRQWRRLGVHQSTRRRV